MNQPFQAAVIGLFWSTTEGHEMTTGPGADVGTTEGTTGGKTNPMRMLSHTGKGKTGWYYATEVFWAHDEVPF